MRGGAGRWTTALAILGPLAVSGIVQLPILGSYFFADDYFNFLRIADGGCLRFATKPMAGHVLAVRNALTCLQYAAFGLHAGGYFACVLATHLVNVALLFQVVRTMTGRRDVAAVAATVWGASPLHAEPLSWYAVYGQLLTLTILLAVLAAVLAEVRRGDPPRAGVAVTCVLLLTLGVACFGTGVAIALVTPLALLVAAPPVRRRGAARAVLLAAPVLAVVTYVGLQWLGRRLGETTAWEADVAGSGLAVPGQVAAMLIALGRCAAVRLVAGAWMGPASALGPASWIALAALASIVGAGMAAGGPATRRNVAGTALLCLGIYGVIAAGRAGIYSALGFAPARAAATERYHYAGSAMLVACVAVAVAGLCRRRSWAGLAAAAVVILAVAQAWGWHRRPIAFRLASEGRRVVASRLQEVDAAVRRAPPGETVVLENAELPPSVRGIFRQALVPGTAALALIAGRSDQRLGRTLRFREPSDAVRAAYGAPESRWLSRMLVPARVNPTVAPGMPATSACELVAVKRLLGHFRRLLRCEEADLGGRTDRATCRAAADAAVARRPAVACRACNDFAAQIERLNAGMNYARGPMRCASADAKGPAPTPTARRCGESAIAAADELVRGLVACRRRSIVRDGTSVDDACAARVVATHRARLGAVRADCGDCSGADLERGVQQMVGEVFQAAFCTPSAAP